MFPSNRRDFLRQTACGLAAGALAAESAAPVLAADPKGKTVKDGFPIVDTHQHLWDLKLFNLPWAKGNAVLDRSFVLSDYQQATEGLNIAKAVYMEVDVHPSQQVKEAEYVIDICKRGDAPTVAAVISGRPNSAEFRDYIQQFADSPYVKGVRQVLHGDSTPAGYCLQSQFVKGVQLLGELGKSFDLCMRPGEIGDGVKLVEQCPKTRFIVDHCGNMSVQSTDEALRKKWQDAMQAMAQLDNEDCKISGIVVTAKPHEWKAADLAPNIDFCLDTFGKNRVMFGGDWPVCTLTSSYKDWVAALRLITARRSSEEQRMLFHDNAVRFYGLS